MSEPVIVRYAAGNALSCRYADGEGWDATYNDNGNVLTFRRTDGTGWGRTYDKNGNELTYTEIFPEAAE